MMEQVLVIKREKLEQYIGGRNGLIRDNTEELLDVIMNGHEFMPRPEAEERPDYKQIIPYVILLQGDKVFVTRRLNKGGEARTQTASEAFIWARALPLMSTAKCLLERPRSLKACG